MQDDKLNVVYVLDSDTFPFYRAENYHQFHNGLGKAFPTVSAQVTSEPYVYRML